MQQLNLEAGRRLEAICRSDVDPSTLRLKVTRHNGLQREPVPLGLSFLNGSLSLGAVTIQDDGLEFNCSSDHAFDILKLNVHVPSMLQLFFLIFICLLFGSAALNEIFIIV